MQHRLQFSGVVNVWTTSVLLYLRVSQRISRTHLIPRPLSLDQRRNSSEASPLQRARPSRGQNRMVPGPLQHSAGWEEHLLPRWRSIWQQSSGIWSRGFCVVGEEAFSFGYGGTGKKSSDCKFADYGEKFGENDVIGCYVVSRRWEIIQNSFFTPFFKQSEQTPQYHTCWK